MFTGIIDHCGILRSMDVLPGSQRLWIDTQCQDLVLGESIAINGICVTVADIQGQAFRCDLSPETLRVTTASQYKEGDKINIERALLPSSRMGGHTVTGHVDGVCSVKTIRPMNDFIEVTFQNVTKHNKRFLMKKGSVAINGVSLTVNDVTDEGFSVMLIPHTLKLTNLSSLKEKDAVNIEFDMMARMIIQQCDHYFAALQAG